MKKKLIVLPVLFALAVFASAAFAAQQKNEAAAAIEEITGSKTATAQSTAQTNTAPAAQDAAKPTEQTASDGVRPLKASPMEAGAPETEETLLVTPEWLKKNRANVIIVDARPESLYASGHIAGAVNASWTYFANTSAPSGTMKYGTIHKPATMSKRIGALGINGKKTVVAYCDAGGWGPAGWTVWILRMAGIKNAKILNGGFTGWKKAGGLVTKMPQRNKAVAFSYKQIKPNYLVDTAWINNNLGKPGLAIIDVRTSAEYNGKIRPFQEKRAGHLPGAINIEMEEFVTEGHEFREEAAIEEALAKRNITKDTEIVVYDTAGVRAAYVTMALRYAGFNKSQCYDEGFQAWAGKADLPLEKTE